MAIEGTVGALGRRRARVGTTGGDEWAVPYPLLRIVGKARLPDCRLEEVEALGRSLLVRHAGQGHLDTGWDFGFDLARTRAGVCRHGERRITLSVSYCLRASRGQIRDTLLHEIAHAICGPDYGHDDRWRGVATRLGCSARRCHRVVHTAPRWVGRCGCDKRWFRHRLARSLRHASCGKCRSPIRWSRNSDGFRT